MTKEKQSIFSPEAEKDFLEGHLSKGRWKLIDDPDLLDDLQTLMQSIREFLSRWPDFNAYSLLTKGIESEIGCHLGYLWLNFSQLGFDVRKSRQSQNFVEVKSFTITKAEQQARISLSRVTKLKTALYSKPSVQIAAGMYLSDNKLNAIFLGSGSLKLHEYLLCLWVERGSFTEPKLKKLSTDEEKIYYKARKLSQNKQYKEALYYYDESLKHRIDFEAKPDIKVSITKLINEFNFSVIYFDNIEDFLDLDRIQSIFKTVLKDRGVKVNEEDSINLEDLDKQNIRIERAQFDSRGRSLI